MMIHDGDDGDYVGYDEYGDDEDEDDAGYE